MSIVSVGHNTVSPSGFYGDIKPQTTKQTQTQTESNVKPQVIQSKAADIQRISQALSNKKLRFVVDQGSNQVIVKVIDKDTDKVIKELPPEELQRLHSNLKEVIGLLLNEMA
ncbi:MAG: flagellar protein FlaG [Treponema sp.]|nr:flagellar protein FlaG [Treponema sp.]